MRPTILGGASPGVPRPLVHRDEVNVRLILDQRLSAVAMMDIPVDDENALQSMFLARVVRGDGDVAEQAESHRAIVDSMMTGRPDGAKAARMHATDCEVDRGQHAPGSRRRRLPRPTAGDGVGVESPTALFGKHSNGADMRGVVCKLQFLDRCVPTFYVLDAMKQFRIFPQCPGDRAQPTDVFRMSPSCIVATAIAM